MNVEIIIVVIVVAFLVYVSKSYLFYHEENPYKGKGENYARPFEKRSGGDLYDEVLRSEYGLIAALMAKVVKADGRVCELERELIDSTLDELAGYFSHPRHARSILEEILENEEKEHGNIDLIAGEFVNYTRNDPNKRIKIIEFLINLGFADKHLSEAEEETIGKIAFHFKIKAGEYRQILESFKSYYAHYRSGDKNPYEVLGVEETVTASELKSVYRRLVKEHHPDVIKGQGMGEAFVNQATAKLQEINEAYETLKKAKGF